MTATPEDAGPWKTFQDVNLYRLTSVHAYCYQVSDMQIDADGAPNAYHPKDVGLDALKHAKYPHGAWENVLVPDPKNPQVAYEQPGGPYKGYFVSMTSLQAPESLFQVQDPQKYVDATAIPYIVFPYDVYVAAGTGLLGDIVVAMRTNAPEWSWGVIADVGETGARLGEVSIKMAENLGGTNVSPRDGHGAPHGPFTYVVFPYSATKPAWPRSIEDLEVQANDLIERAGGIDALRRCP